MTMRLDRRRGGGWKWLAGALFGKGRRTGRRPVRARRPGIEALETRLALAVTPSLVLDINALPVGSDPTGFALVGDVAYFTAADATHGRELWRTDGTVAGTRLVADIQPGGLSSEPRQLTVVGSTLFFAASQGGDRELWKSDGTEAGTVRVKDIRTTGNSQWGPPEYSSHPSDLVALGSTLFFSADNGTDGRELWKSDGTEAGTVMVKDLKPGIDPWGDYPKSSFPSYLVPLGGRLYFVAGTADDSHDGDVLFSTDGTAEGTVVVSTIDENWSGYPADLAVSGDRLFFSAISSLGGRGLWTSDGSTDGTVMVASIGGSWNAVQDIVPFGSGVLFAGNDGETGSEPWFSDGTAEGTGLLADIAADDGSGPSRAVVAGGVAYFSAFDATHGRELWRTDGTAGGTRLVRDIRPGADSGAPLAISPLAAGVGFAANDGVHGVEPWYSDGTETGTVLARDVNPDGDGIPVTASGSYAALVRLNGRLLFGADEGDGSQLWASDGTTAGTQRVSAIPLGTKDAFDGEGNGGSASYVARAVLDGFLYFPADDGVHGTGLWKSDGTAAGTSLVADLSPGTQSVAISRVVTTGGKIAVLVQGGWDPILEDQMSPRVFVVGGSPASATLIAMGDIADIFDVAGSLFVISRNGQILRSDGTEDGTVVVEEAIAGFGVWFDDYAVVGDRLFYEKTSEVETEQGTTTVGSVWSVGATGPAAVAASAGYPEHYNAGEYVSAFGTLGFVVSFYDAELDREVRNLWKVDSNGAVARVSDLQVGYGIGEGGSATTSANFWFNGQESSGTMWLAKSDGTAEGTKRIATVGTQPENGSSWVQSMTAAGGGAGDRVFFIVVTWIQGEGKSADLWVSDGTEAGTKAIVADVEDIEGLIDGKLAYRATRDGVSTLFLADAGGGSPLTISPPAAARSGSKPSLLGAVGNTLLLVASDATHGRELFAASLATPPGKPTGVSATASSGAATVTWTAPASDGGSAVTDYLLERSSDGGSSWTVVADGVSTATTASVTGLVNGTSYRFRVAAVNGAGSSAWSDASAAVTPITVAGKPTGVSATASSGAATVTWTAPASDGGSAVTDYLLERSSDGGSSWTAVADGVSTATTASVTGLVNGTSYRFRVAAVNGAGSSAWSDASAAVTPITVAGKPTAVSATASSGAATVTWTAPASDGGSAVTDYLLERSSDGGLSWTAVADGVSTATTASVTGLVNGTSYRFRVAAVNGAGSSAWSDASAAVTPITVAGKPTAVSATASSGAATVTWTAPASDGGSAVTDYLLERSSDGGSSWTAVADGVSTATTASVTGLVNGTSYRFRVAAVNGAGSSAWSDASAAVTPTGLPGAATGLVATPADGRVGLAWAAPASDGGRPVTDYVVESSTDGGKTWKVVADGTSAATTANVTGLVNGTSYIFRVAAVTEIGTGPASVPSAPAIPAKPAGAPTAVKATRGDAQVSLAWKAPTSNGGSPITDYLVQSSTDGGKTWVTAADGVSTQLSAIVNGLVNGKPYVFRVAAVNSVGPGTFSTFTPPVVPAGLPAVATDLAAVRGNASVSLSWKAPANTGGLPITDYVIQSSKDGGTTWKTEADKVSADAKALVSGLVNGVSYVFRVGAKNAVGVGPWTAPSAVVVPATVPGIILPASATAKGGDSLATLAWKAPASNGGVPITDYVVQSSTDGGKTWTTESDGVSTAPSATIQGLVNGKSYVFRVAAVNEVGTGAFTPKSAVVVPAAAPGVPTGLMATRGNAKVTLTWTAPASTGGVPITDYAVERSADGGATWVKVTRAKSPLPTATAGGLSNSVSYLFRVAAVNAAGLRGAFAEVTSNVSGPT